MTRRASGSRALAPNYSASCQGIPDWHFFERDHNAAIAMAATFTRWSLEHAGRAGKFDATLTEIKSGTAESFTVKAGAPSLAETP